MRSFLIIAIFTMQFFLLGSTSLGSNLCAIYYKKENINFVSAEFAKEFPRIAKAQPVEVRVQGKKVLAYNREIADFLKKASDLPTQAELSEIIQLLLKNKVMEFPLTEEGYLAAANNGNHDGGYGKYMWFRDLARSSQGLKSLVQLIEDGRDKVLYNEKEELMTKALVRLLSEKEQIARTLNAIINPKIIDDPVTGYKNVPFVRLSIEGRREGQGLTPEIIQNESAWGHKQNDAIALYEQNILDKVAAGELKIEMMSIESQAELIFLAAYFQRVSYFKMKDLGAWEEKMGVRTSSLSLVLSFLERFDQGWKGNVKDKNKTEAEIRNETAFFNSLKDNWEKGLYDSVVTSFLDGRKVDRLTEHFAFRRELDLIKNTINTSFEFLQRAIGEGYSVLKDRLRAPKMMEVVDQNNPSSERGIDAAFLHLLLYPPKEMSLYDRLELVNKINNNGDLLRDSGFVRYLDDWFLLGGPNAMKFANVLIPENPDAIAVADGNGFRNSTRADRDELVAEYDRQKDAKDMSKIIERNGTRLEAQWSFQDSMLVQIYVQFYKETKNEEFKKKAWFHLSRALGLITGETQINIEGQPVTPWKAPEALIPVRIMHQGNPQVVYFASPNSPLNWTTAELAKALADYQSIL